MKPWGKDEMQDDEPQIHSCAPGGMPETPVNRWVQPFSRFFQIQSASGFLLLACTAMALLLANSPWSAAFAEIWQIRLRISVGQFELDKPIGIVLFSWIATKLGVVRLPSEVNWKIMLGAGCLAGIGFTMSIFIAGLALPGKLLDEGKIGTLVGSMISTIVGCVLLFIFMPKRSGTPIGTHVE